MNVRRIVLCLAAAFLWATYEPDMASGQSSELMDAYNSFNTLYQQGRYPHSVHSFLGPVEGRPDLFGVFKGLAQIRPFPNDAGTTSTRVITSD